MNDLDIRLSTLERHFQDDGIGFVLVQFVDIHGAAKVKLIPASTLRSAAETGAGFAGGAVWGMGQGPHSHDMCARVDLQTYTPLPYEPGIARFAADLYVDDQPHPFCPRVNLKRVLGLARERGYDFQAGMEPEFFLVRKQPDGGICGWDPGGVNDLSKPCYDYKGMSAALGVLRAINEALLALDWGIYQTDHEDANDQYEVNFRYSEALTTADRITFFRMLVGQVAARHGAVATFMAKPFADRTGSSAHLHYHLSEPGTGRNLFLDDDDPRGLGLSTLAYRFLGGVIEHAPALCAVTSPTVNCFKRLQAGHALTGSRSGFTWVPARISYGDNNRTQMLRVPEGGHVEDRSFSSACNPYLALAAYMAAGLDGIDRGLDPGEPSRANLYTEGTAAAEAEPPRYLPQSLAEALDALEADPVVLGGLGPIAGEFLHLKRDEWRAYHAQVGAWELARYLTAL